MNGQQSESGSQKLNESGSQKLNRRSFLKFFVAGTTAAALAAKGIRRAEAGAGDELSEADKQLERRFAVNDRTWRDLTSGQDVNGLQVAMKEEGRTDLRGGSWQPGAVDYAGASDVGINRAKPGYGKVDRRTVEIFTRGSAEYAKWFDDDGQVKPEYYGALPELRVNIPYAVMDVARQVAKDLTGQVPVEVQPAPEVAADISPVEIAGEGISKAPVVDSDQKRRDALLKALGAVGLVGAVVLGVGVAVAGRRPASEGESGSEEEGDSSDRGSPTPDAGATIERVAARRFPESTSGR